MSSTESLASQHLAIAVQLMGSAWVLAQLTAPQAAAPPPASNRGRKPGAIPEPDRRCRWQPEGREQCKNSRFDNNSYCKIHLSQVHLIDQ
jgi:hypothetical protein